MNHPLVSLTTLTVTKTDLGPEEEKLVREYIKEAQREHDTATSESKRSDHRLISFLIEEDTTLQAMSDRLKNLSKYGDTLAS